MCHIAEATLDVWRPVFEDRIISRRAEVVWPPLSCDWTPLDYYLWRAVKDNTLDNLDSQSQMNRNIFLSHHNVSTHILDLLDFP